MTWVAPDVERHEPSHFGDESESLTSWLRFYRETVLWKCAGLDTSQLRSRSCLPSKMSLLGVVRHLTDVERAWFRQRIAGQADNFVYWTEPDRDPDFDEVDDADPATDFAAFEAECRNSESVLVGRGLDEVIEYQNRSGDSFSRSVRWILIHMIEEYARHLGHCDLIRERIDGSTGY